MIDARRPILVVLTVVLASGVGLPAAEPLPLPAPTWLLLFLLYLTFTLHMIAMNLTVGGGVMLSIFSFYGGENRIRLVSFLSRALPILLAFTITLGVAPLLFVQVLYGRIFFTTSILMGWWWLIVVVLLVLAYYGFYLRQYSPRWFGSLRDALPLISTVMLLIIALLYVANFKLFFRSDEWLNIYHSNPPGWFLNLAHPLVLPIYAHHIISAVALGGLLMVLHLLCLLTNPNRFLLLYFHFFHHWKLLLLWFFHLENKMVVIIAKLLFLSCQSTFHLYKHMRFLPLLLL